MREATARDGGSEDAEDRSNGDTVEGSTPEAMVARPRPYWQLGVGRAQSGLEGGGEGGREGEGGSEGGREDRPS